MEPFKMNRPAAKAAQWKEAQKFGPTLSLYTREDAANQNYLYFVLKSYKDGTEANMDVEGEEGTGKGGFISFLQGPKEENNISGQITAGQQPAGYYPLFLDTCFDPERGIAISGGFASFILWVFAYDFDRREAVLLNRDRQIVLSPTELGEIVVKSHLKEVGKLDYLNVGGNVVIDAGLTVNGGMYTTSIFADTYLNLPPLDPTQLTPLTLDAANFRVGISNPLPQYALDVSGDVNVSGQFLVNGQPVTTDLTPITLDPDATRVGINQPNPQYTLDVLGNANISNSLRALQVATASVGVNDLTIRSGPVPPEGSVVADPGSLYMDYNGKLWIKETGAATNTGWVEASTQQFNPDPITLDPINDRVGINNTVPNTALDVTGNGHFTGTVDAENLAARNSLLVAGDSTFMGNLDVKGGVGIDGDLSVIGNAVLFNADVLNSVSAYKFFSGNSFLVGGAGNPEGVVDGAPGSIFMSDSGTLYAKSGTGNTGWKALGSGVTPSDLLPITLDKPNNRVGINNATPAYTLGVGGDANLSTGGTYRISTFPVVAARASNTTIALGRTDMIPDVSTNAVAIGFESNAGPSSISIGANSGKTMQGLSAVAIGNTTANTEQGSYAVAAGFYAGTSKQGESAVAIGPNAGKYTQGTAAVAIGSSAGTGTTTAATGQGNNAVAIGSGAGNASQGTNSVSIGVNSGQNTQSSSSVAIGANAGRYGQGASSVAIGSAAGTGSTTAGTGQGIGAVAVGVSSGSNTQGASAVAIGNGAGSNTQGQNAIGIGVAAANNSQSSNAVAIGNNAGNLTQGDGCIAIGQTAGQTSQSLRAIAIGRSAGFTTQGEYAIAVGALAGQTNQHANSVIMNATGVALNSDGTSRFYVKPIRQNTTATNRLGYDPTTGEITYADVAPAPNITSTIVTSPNYGSNTDFSFDVLLPQPGLYQIHVDHAHKFISAYTVTTRYMIVIYGGVLTDTGVLNSKPFSKISDICEIPLGTYAINNKTVGTSATFFSIAVASYGTFTINCQVQNPNNIPVNTFETTRRVTVMKLV